MTGPHFRWRGWEGLVYHAHACMRLRSKVCLGFSWTCRSAGMPQASCRRPVCKAVCRSLIIHVMFLHQWQRVPLRTTGCVKVQATAMDLVPTLRRQQHAHIHNCFYTRSTHASGRLMRLVSSPEGHTAQSGAVHGRPTGRHHDKQRTSRWRLQRRERSHRRTRIVARGLSNDQPI